jgi:hypothetical protein
MLAEQRSEAGYAFQTERFVEHCPWWRGCFMIGTSIMI